MCKFDYCGTCYAMACHSDRPCGSRDETGEPNYADTKDCQEFLKKVAGGGVMNETQKQTCLGRKAAGNCLLAGENDRLTTVITAIQKDISGLDEQLLARDKQYGSVVVENERLRAEIAAVVSVNKKMWDARKRMQNADGFNERPSRAYVLAKSEWNAAQEELLDTVHELETSTAGADLLGRHKTEIKVYREALEQIRELAVAEYRITEAEEEINSLADQALNDRWGADEWVVRVHKLEAAVEAATRLCKIKAANEMSMGDAWTQLEIALAKLDGVFPDGGGKCSDQQIVPISVLQGEISGLECDVKFWKERREINEV